MHKLAQKWIKMAENDFQTADLLFKAGHKRGFAYQACVFHCHQAIEKMLKAVLCEQNKNIPKIHNLVRLLVLTELKISAKLRTAIGDLNPHYLLPRYPDLVFRPSFSFSYNEKDTKKTICQTKEIILWLKKNPQSKK